MNNYQEKFKNLPTVDILDIIEHADDFDKDAVEAAQAELDKRRNEGENVCEVEERVIRKEEHVAEIKEKAFSKLAIIKEYFSSLLEILNPKRMEFTSIDKVMGVLLSVIFLFVISDIYAIIIHSGEQIEIWQDAIKYNPEISITYWIFFIAYNSLYYIFFLVSFFFFWRRWKIGWILLFAWATLKLTGIMDFLFYQILDNFIFVLSDSNIRSVPILDQILNYVKFFFLTIISFYVTITLLKAPIRKDIFKIGKKVVYIVLILVFLQKIMFFINQYQIKSVVHDSLEWDDNRISTEDPIRENAVRSLEPPAPIKESTE